MAWQVSDEASRQLPGEIVGTLGKAASYSPTPAADVGPSSPPLLSPSPPLLPSSPPLLFSSPAPQPSTPQAAAAEDDDSVFLQSSAGNSDRPVLHGFRATGGRSPSSGLDDAPAPRPPRPNLSQYNR